MDEGSVYFSGVDGTNGKTLYSPLRLSDLVTSLVGDSSGATKDPTLQVFATRYQNFAALPDPKDSNQYFEQTPDAVSPGSISTMGWGVIFTSRSDPSIKQALGELLALRNLQAGDLYREFEGPAGYRLGESTATFLARNEIGFGAVDPQRMPYFLLLIGDPQSIPYSFQQDLSMRYAVGRIWFDSLEEYALYALSVVASEQGGAVRPYRVASFVPMHPDDTVSNQIAELFQWSRSVVPDDLERYSFAMPEPTKSQLVSLLGEHPPALLAMAGHSVFFARDSDHQPTGQGGLLCQNWPGSTSGPVPAEFVFAADDVSPNIRPLGMVIVDLSSYSAGAGGLLSGWRLDDSQHLGLQAQPSLPQRLLGHPRGGALAFVGYAGPVAVGDFYSQHGTMYMFKEALQIVLRRIVEGWPFGDALGVFRNRYSDWVRLLSATEITSEQADLAATGEYFLGCLLAGGITLLGDPAARLTLGSDVAPEFVPMPEPATMPRPPHTLGALLGAVSDRVGEQLVDQLDFADYAIALTDLIVSPHAQLPLTIGIFGSWGTGKSFLLELVKQEVVWRTKAQQKSAKKSRAPAGTTEPARDADAPRPVYIVPFNAWESNATDLIWPGLVRTVMDTIEAEKHGIPGKFRRQFWRKFRSVRGSVVVVLFIIGILGGLLLWYANFQLAVVWAALLGLSTLGGLGKLMFDAYTDPLSKWFVSLFEQQHYGTYISYMAEIREDLVLLDKRLQHDQERILIIIDDLDRCEPKKAVEVLQAINLLLNFDSFVVCLGIDARIITQAVEKYYENLLGKAGATGYEYLDKIIQIPFRIPPPTQLEIERFLALQTGDPQPLPPVTQPPEQEPTQTGDPQPPPPTTQQRVQEPTQAHKLEQPKPDALGWPEAEAAGRAEKPTQSVEQQADGDHTADAGAQPAKPALAAFTYDELQAIQRLSRYLRPNPRHLKRLLNLYRLVRALASRKRQFSVMRDPDKTFRWIVMCSQWPYIINKMLEHYDDLLDQRFEKKLKNFPGGDPLTYLLGQVKLTTPGEQALQRAVDYDDTLLRQLIQREEGRVSWEELEIFRQYTINFNPAIEEAVQNRQPEQAAK
jgi:hypothetical protein